MKKLFRLAPLLLIIVFLVSQCTNPVANNPEDIIADGEMSLDDRIEEIEFLDKNIQEMTAISLDESTIHARNKALRALGRLNLFLYHIEIVVDSSGSDSARVVFDEALAARDSATTSIEMDSIRLAFEYIREGRELGREAFEIATGNEFPTFEDIFEELVLMTHELDNLLFEVEDALDGTNIPGAKRAFARALHHRRRADAALYNRKLRKARFHIRESFRYANFVLWLIENQPSE